MTYSCFEHPDAFRGERSLSDTCTTCGRRYDYWLSHAPPEIDGYTVVPPALGRGFYGASFLVKHPLLGNKLVFKVVPVATYDLFGKDFLAEARHHIAAAQGTQHVVPLLDVKGAPDGVDLDFGGVSIRCFVQVLEYVDGESLESVLRDPRIYGARGSAQIAVDLLRLLDELSARRIRHNDLHPNNILIERLAPEGQRAGVIEESLRVVAIDLGSLSSADASDSATSRLSDVHRVGSYLRALSAGLLSDVDGISDTDYRLAQALEEVAMQMTRPTKAMRVVDFVESSDLIREAVLFADAPWRDPGSLKRFNAGYNAAVLGASFVPRLLVDPGDEWSTRIASPGPQLVTGMRGCGKTMLLKALEVHSRINRAQQKSAGDSEGTLDELRGDDYVGLYESSDRLLDGLGNTQGGRLHRPEARLFIAYARDAVQALRHIQAVDPQSVDPLYPQRIAHVVAEQIPGAARLSGLVSGVGLEQALHQMLVHLAQGDSTIELPADPSIAFPDLAEAIQQSSPLWSRSRVLFLLDDASTRNLAVDNIDHLCSRLLFKHERCAFKITTEQQALEQLRSPALLEAIQIGRDIDLFDLGGEVNERMRQRGPTGGRSFIAQILEARAVLYEQHPRDAFGNVARPEEVLGNATLESIAKQIAGAGEPPREGSRTAAVRKRLETVYHGLTALSAVCVGDIGDMLAIYDLILRKAEPGSALPLSPKLQSQAFREYSVRRLWNLNSRKKDLRPYADSFAKAAHSLLVQSHKRGARLRQYASIHVQIDPVHAKEQFDAILGLIDAGIFVFEGGNYGPRLKRFSGNPKTEFILNFRKLFGLTNYIGLAERDRFELRGDAITNWLSSPDDPDVLTRRLGGRDLRFGDDDLAGMLDADLLLVDSGAQLALSTLAPFGHDDTEEAGRQDDEFVRWRMPDVQRLEVPPSQPCTLITGWGFEDRTLESLRWLVENVSIEKVVLLEYPTPGKSAMVTLLRDKGIEVEQLPASTLNPLAGCLLDKPVIVDVTGLTKALIFTCVREALRRDAKVFVAHSRAEVHWPRNEDLEPILQSHRDEVNLFAILDDIEQLHTGDRGEYEFVRLLASGADGNRPRLLAAGASVKHMRLHALLENREYDRLEVLVPDTDSPRSQVARHAAEAARRGAEAATVQAIDFDDPCVIVDWLGRRYRRWFGHGGFDVEVVLSGSKMHAVAAAAVSDAVKVAQAWYVRPTEIEPEAYSQGYRGTELFEIKAPPAQEQRDYLIHDVLRSEAGE